MDAKEITMTLGEDKLIKIRTKMPIMRLMESNKSLLRYKSMLRSATKNFMKEKIIPYFH